MRRGLVEHVRAAAEEAVTCLQRSDITGLPLGFSSSSLAVCFEMKHWFSFVSTVCHTPEEGGFQNYVHTHHILPCWLYYLSDSFSVTFPTLRYNMSVYCHADNSGLICPLPNTSNWIINSSSPWNTHKPRHTGQICDSSLRVFSILILYVSPVFFFPWLLCKEITAKWRGKSLNILKSSFSMPFLGL